MVVVDYFMFATLTPLEKSTQSSKIPFELRCATDKDYSLLQTLGRLNTPVSEFVFIFSTHELNLQERRQEYIGNDSQENLNEGQGRMQT